MRFSATVFALLTLGTSARLRAQGAEVGVVAEYRPAAGRYVFERGAERIPVRIATVVRAGDRVVLPAGAAVVVQLGTGPLTLEKTATVPASPPLGNVMRYLRSVRTIFDDEFRLSGTAGSRGGEKCGRPADPPVAPLAMPLFSTDARVVARTRDLPITWVGGCAPYVVAILKGADTAAVRRNIDTDRARLDDVRLAPGRYRVVLSDGANQRVEGSFEAVTELPALPADLAADRTDLGIIAQAIWLSDADGGRWRLDAFDRLRPLLRTGNALAGAIGDGILWSRPNDRPQR